MKYFSGLLFAVVVANCSHGAEPADGLHVPAIFGDHMVLQRDKPIRVWGWDKPGQKVSVLIAPEEPGLDGQARSGKAGDDGRWEVTMPAMKAGGPYRFEITGSESKNFKDVMIGEVWICSGQSNMAWTVKNSNHSELEIAAANFPNIRMISVPQVGTQEPQNDFKGHWARCSPEVAKEFLCSRLLLRSPTAPHVERSNRPGR